ncbi:MAG: hypothetical protein ABIQ59_11420 [Nocardioidaceae bacterium]
MLSELGRLPASPAKDAATVKPPAGSCGVIAHDARPLASVMPSQL